MESVRAAVYLSVCLSVLTSLCQGQRSADNQLDDPTLGLTTKELAEALQGFLDEANSSVGLSVEKKASVIPRAEALQGFLDEANSSVGLSVEKKASVIPRCDLGERCAMKHGPRIGRLCDCLRGTSCNTFFLRCY